MTWLVLLSDRIVDVYNVLQILPDTFSSYFIES